MEFIIPWIMTVPKGTNLLSAYHIFSLRSKDRLIRFHVSYPTFLQVLFFHVFRYTALWLSIPLNTRINTDSSTAFIVIIYLQLMDVRSHHLSCVGDTINVLINAEKYEHLLIF